LNSLGCINTTQLSTGRREKLPVNPFKLTGDALWKKANKFDKNNNLCKIEEAVDDEEMKNQTTLSLKKTRWESILNY
jgi:hypothetical protein